jgi:hypothetical protein
VVQGSLVCEADLLIGMNTHAWALAGGIAFALANRNHGRITIGININAVVAAFLDCEGQVRSINFVDLSLKESANMKVQRSLVKFHLNAVIGDVGQCHAGFITHAKYAGADVEFRA